MTAHKEFWQHIADGGECRDWELNGNYGFRVVLPSDLINIYTYPWQYTLRRKPKTIRIGEYDVPEPFRSEPERGEEVYVANLDSCWFDVWDGSARHKGILKQSRLFRTEEDAELARTALLSLMGGEM